MQPNRVLVYDLEILKPIITDPAAAEQCPIPYVDSWQKHAEMGISVLCAPTLEECQKYSAAQMYRDPENWDFGRSSHFTETSFGGTLNLVESFFSKHDLFVSFNGLGFDNKVMRANGIFVDESRCYDILEEWRKATGKRVSLDALFRANFPGETGKTGSGANAPFMWQAGKHEEVITYCFGDTIATARIFQKILNQRSLINPYNGSAVTLPLPQAKAATLF